MRLRHKAYKKVTAMPRIVVTFCDLLFFGWPLSATPVCMIIPSSVEAK